MPALEILRFYGPSVTPLIVILGFVLKFGSRLTRVGQQCTDLQRGLDQQLQDIRTLRSDVLTLQTTVQQMASSVAELKGFLSALAQQGRR